MLRRVTDDLWTTEYDLMLPGRLCFNARMTVIRLGDGSLLLHSPIPIDDALAAELAELGPVGHIVAPNRLHHLSVVPTATRYPDARVYVSPGLPEKRPDIRFDARLDGSAPPAWGGALEPALIEGADGIAEVVFLHRPSRTLVCTDLVFNIHEGKTLMTRLILRMVGAWRRVGQSKAWRWFFTKDRSAAGASVRAILDWDFDRVIMAHGEIIESGGKEALRGPLEWMLKEARRGLGPAVA